MEIAISNRSLHAATAVNAVVYFGWNAHDSKLVAGVVSDRKIESRSLPLPPTNWLEVYDRRTPDIELTRWRINRGVTQQIPGISR